MTWELGDMALCIIQLSKRGIETIRPGSIHTVTGVIVCPVLGTMLHLDTLPKNELAVAPAFRKIPPLTRREHDEFLTDLEFDLDVLALQEMYRR